MRRTAFRVGYQTVCAACMWEEVSASVLPDILLTACSRTSVKSEHRCDSCDRIFGSKHADRAMKKINKINKGGFFRRIFGKGKGKGI